MPHNILDVRLSPTDYIAATRRPDSYLSLQLGAELTVEIPPELAASLFAGLLSVMAPKPGCEVVTLHPKADAERKLFSEGPCDQEHA